MLPTDLVSFLWGVGATLAMLTVVGFATGAVKLSQERGLNHGAKVALNRFLLGTVGFFAFVVLSLELANNFGWIGVQQCPDEGIVPVEVEESVHPS